jgi:tRNA(fMet)-specific endonuclease VapC
MALAYLLDTNIVIYLRMKRPQAVAQRILALESGEAGFSIITLGELRFGIEKSADPRAGERQLTELTELIPVVGLPESTAAHYGEIRADLEKQGRKIGNNDLWIAAHAKALGLTLVTNNEKEFKRVRGLTVENWAK